MRVNVLLDSSVWIEYFTNGSKVKKIAEKIVKSNKKTYRTPTLVLFEVYKKIKKELNERVANEAIAYIIDLTELVPLNERISIHAAEISIQTNLAMADSIIKATAELTNSKLITFDNHFKSFENVQIV